MHQEVQNMPNMVNICQVDPTTNSERKADNNRQERVPRRGLSNPKVA